MEPRRSQAPEEAFFRLGGTEGKADVVFPLYILCAFTDSISADGSVMGLKVLLVIGLARVISRLRVNHDIRNRAIIIALLSLFLRSLR